MKALFRLLILPSWFFLFSCQNPKNPSENNRSHIDTISYKIDVINKNMACAQQEETPCLQISINTIKLQPSSKKDTAIPHIQKAIDEALIATDASEKKAINAEDFAQNLWDEYKRIITEMPEYTTPWRYDRTIKINLNKNGLFEVEISLFSFTGGAHGNHFVYYYVFDATTGKMLQIKDIITKDKWAQFQKIAFMKFSISQGITNIDDLNSNGYWFENNTFSLPNNFSINANELRFLYNPYEIAPYSEGAISLHFSWEEIKNFLKEDYHIIGKL